jgi:glycosyltransferase involved in cell wall biosynthesis
MRVLILAPTALPQITGNAVTVERWRRGLAALGHEVRVVAAEGLERGEFGGHLQDFQPHVVHAHHLFKAGGLALEVLAIDAPLVASPAGTDLNEDVASRQRGEAVERVLRRARVVLVPAEPAATEVARRFPWLRERIHLAPKALTWLGRAPFDLRAEIECNREHVIFFLPAGVRPVKRNRECLEALAEVHRLRPQVRAVFAGPALDPDYAWEFARALTGRSFARWLDPIAPSAMESALRSADVVLNTSRSEGMSNVLLEAVAAGVPTLASDISANRWALANGGDGAPAGLFFEPEDWGGFIREAVRLVDEPALRDALSRAARLRAEHWPTGEEEARNLEAAYRRAVEEGEPGGVSW